LPNEKKKSYPENPKTSVFSEVIWICPECSKLVGSMQISKTGLSLLQL